MSFTTVAHPPAGFPAGSRMVGLIALETGKQVMGQLIVPNGVTPHIGARVAPRMRLQRTTEQNLRVYDIAYELAAVVAQEQVEESFRGYILAISGPSGVGKTSVSRLLLSLVGDAVVHVPIVTTRKRKQSDQGEYVHATLTAFREELAAGRLAASVHLQDAEEERWYGYRKADIERIWAAGKLPVVITEMHLLQQLSQAYGRRSILSFGLLPPGASRRAMLSQLLHRLRTRGRDTEASIESRLAHAKQDLDFYRKEAGLFDELLVNDDLETVTKTLQGKLQDMKLA